MDFQYILEIDFFATEDAIRNQEANPFKAHTTI